MKALLNSHIVVDERCCPAEDEALAQPFLPGANRSVPALSWLEKGDWADLMNHENTALALSQVTAANVLPPLLDLPTGVDLLQYRVELRDQLDPILVRELALILENQWQALGWEQVSETSFLCVIGAGVAACIETTPGEECLYLRYASVLANELFHAGRAIDLPRSRLFLQTTLHEKINPLLARLRDRCWQWV
jgi:hypothetical protein